jgi:hypothetical protein
MLVTHTVGGDQSAHVLDKSMITCPPDRAALPRRGYSTDRFGRGILSICIIGPLRVLADRTARVKGVDRIPHCLLVQPHGPIHSVPRLLPLLPGYSQPVTH